MPKDDEDIVEVRCPECGAVVKIARVNAERDFKAKCPKGHEVPLVKAL
jgi:phage FluMu protein Com